MRSDDEPWTRISVALVDKVPAQVRAAAVMMHCWAGDGVVGVTCTGPTATR